MFEPSVRAKKGDKSILMLAYYRNNLIHYFVNDALIACALLGFSNIQNIAEGVNVQLVWERVQFIRDLLSKEFLIRKTLNTYQDFLECLLFQAKRGTLTYDEATQLVSHNSSVDSQHYGQSFLVSLLLPLVESYWITVAYFLSLENRHQQHDEE